MSESPTHPDGMFEWSAFGAPYMDTYCHEGMLFDADSETGGEIPCPFCDPTSHWEYEFEGGYVAPTCALCQQILPDGTALRFHDGKGLRCSADCPRCGHQPMLYRDYYIEGESPEPEAWKART